MSGVIERYDGFKLKYISYGLDNINNFDGLIEFFQFAKDNGYSNTNITNFAIECSRELTEEEATLERIRIAEENIKNQQEYLIELKSKLCTK